MAIPVLPLVYGGGRFLITRFAWPALRWVGRNLWTGLKWVGRNLWSGIKWIGNRIGRGLRRPMSMLSKAANFLNILGLADKSTPTHFEEVDVTVFGSPKAKKKDLWRIAVAAAFGKVQRRGINPLDPAGGAFTGVALLPPPGFIQMEYPLEGNAVRIVLRMETPYLSLITGSGIGRANREFELYTGPPDDVKGGEWGFDSLLLGVGANFGATYPKTGFENRTLLTNAPFNLDARGTIRASASPHPIKDKVSRSSAPVAENGIAKGLDPGNWNNNPTFLLFQALSAPCEARLLVPPAGNPPPPPAPSTPIYPTAPPPRPANPDGSPALEPPYDPEYVPPEPNLNPPPAVSDKPQLTTPQQGQNSPLPQKPQTPEPNLPPGFNPAATFPNGLPSELTPQFSGGVPKNGPVSVVLPPIPFSSSRQAY